MDLQTSTTPERVRKWGEEVVIITPPSKIKIQTTGPGAMVLLEEAPPDGKTWSVFIRVEAAETDG